MTEGFKTSVEEVIANRVGIARELELEVGPRGVIELLQSYDKTWMDEELFLVNQQRKWFFEMKYNPGEDCWNDNKGFRTFYNLSW